MDEIFNDPIISHFLQSVKQDNKTTTIKELILLGIHAVNSKIHENSCKCVNLCPCVKVNHPYFQNQAVMHHNSDSNLVREINQMRAKIDELAARANSSNTQQGDTFNNRQDKERKPSRNKQNIQTAYQRTVENEAQGVKKQFRHHLDDSQVRKVLVNPYAPASPLKKEKRKEELQKLHQLQKQKDAMQIKTLKERAERNEKQYDTIQHKMGNVHHSTDEKRKKVLLSSINDENNISNQKQFKRTKNNSVIETKSKIKSLIQKDREKTKQVSSKRAQQQKRAKLCQFQYSDEEESVSEEDLKQESQCPKHSRYRQNDQSQSHEQYSRQDKFKFNQSHTQSRKKQQQESALRQDDGSEEKQGDQISQSSSFSKFSMSSLRENGKISSKLRR